MTAHARPPSYMRWLLPLTLGALAGLVLFGLPFIFLSSAFAAPSPELSAEIARERQLRGELTALSGQFDYKYQQCSTSRPRPSQAAH